MKRKFEAPPNIATTESSKYVGQDPEFKDRSIVTIKTKEGDLIRVVIFRYIKEKGLYDVGKIDEAGKVSPAFKINPDNIVK
jgi:hypothetical protein